MVIKCGKGTRLSERIYLFGYGLKAFGILPVGVILLTVLRAALEDRYTVRETIFGFDTYSFLLLFLAFGYLMYSVGIVLMKKSDSIAARHLTSYQRVFESDAVVVGIGINDSKEQVLTLEAHCDQEQYLISIALFDDVITARPRDVLPLKLRIKYDKTGTAIDYEILH